ncbi:MAG TPA: OmpA family protein [Phnomibacter sp.]|nr:OmpA family protein [Phnomibacter sp.]
MRKIVLGFLSCALFSVAFGQEHPVKRGTLVLQVGAFDFKTANTMRSSSFSSVVGNKQWAKPTDMNFTVGGSYIKGINSFLDYSINAHFGSIKYPVRTATGAITTTRVAKFLSEVDASLHLKLLPDNFIVVPYLSGGLGGSMWNKRFEAFIPLGSGLQIALGSENFLFSNFQYRLPVTQGANYHFFYSFGFGGAISEPKAPEVKPVPVAPVAVVPPADTDGDGIPDKDDKCPTVPGLAKYGGCPIPDTDGDGINDEEDKCPTVKGLARYQGCPIPDTDGDGINDEEDKCPTVKGLARYQGCPIPDTDGDGINDEEDKCPTVAGVAEFKGCPRPQYTANRVLFNTGSAVLRSEGKAELDRLAAFMQEYPSINIVLEGHTDNTGSDELNQKLSEKRAGSAKTYLVSKGISADRIKTEGYGESKPIADNNTAAGRDQNRRVHARADD